jgi:hypothetical protein
LRLWKRQFTSRGVASQIKRQTGKSNCRYPAKVVDADQEVRQIEKTTGRDMPSWKAMATAISLSPVN